jgi:signal recognition particle GTPase
VAFDACEAAAARDADILTLDTPGVSFYLP